MPALGSLKSRLHPARSRRAGFQMPELPKRISEKLEAVEEQSIELGNEILQKEIEKKLGEKSALDLATLSKKYGISILVGKATDLKNQVSDQKIKDILDALDYSQSIQQEIPPSIQKNASGDSLFYIFTHPVAHTIILGFSKVRVIQEMDRPLIK